MFFFVCSSTNETWISNECDEKMTSGLRGLRYISSFNVALSFLKGKKINSQFLRDWGYLSRVLSLQIFIFRSKQCCDIERKFGILTYKVTLTKIYIPLWHSWDAGWNFFFNFWKVVMDKTSYNYLAIARYRFSSDIVKTSPIYYWPSRIRVNYDLKKS